MGKSTLLKMIYANYRVNAGRITVRSADGTVDVTQATPRALVQPRRDTVGYVSQFVVIPRSRPWMWWSSRWPKTWATTLRASRPRARKRAGVADPPAHPRAAVAFAARHLLRREGAAHQHRLQHDQAQAAAAAGRADCIA